MNGNGHDSSLDVAGSDELLRLSVKDAISRYEPIRAAAIDFMEIESSEGNVVLNGLVGSEAQKYVAAQLAARVRGVVAVENRLVTREDVERRVSLALASSADTSHLRINVHVSELIVTLHGVVENPREASEALAVARDAAGGLEVKSEIETLPAGQDAIILEQHSLEGRRLAVPPGSSQQQPTPASPATATPSSNPTAPTAEGLA